MAFICVDCGEDLAGRLAELASEHAQVPCSDCGREHCAKGTCARQRQDVAR